MNRYDQSMIDFVTGRLPKAPHRRAKEKERGLMFFFSFQHRSGFWSSLFTSFILDTFWCTLDCFREKKTITHFFS